MKISQCYHFPRFWTLLIFTGECWPGPSSYLDLYDPAVQDYYKVRYLPENFPGSTLDTHIWNDMNEPSVFNGPEVTAPKDLLHYGGFEHRDVHNTYGMVYVSIRARHIAKQHDTTWHNTYGMVYVSIRARHIAKQHDTTWHNTYGMVYVSIRAWHIVT
jgi:Glycosyl hydrolases family 31